MNLVERWYMETPEGEIIDGPYKNKKEFDREFALYVKQYKYTPIIKKHMVDADGFMPIEKFDSLGIETGKGRRGYSRIRRMS